MGPSPVLAVVKIVSRTFKLDEEWIGCPRKANKTWKVHRREAKAVMETEGPKMWAV